jgi:uncharacterized protein
VPEASCQGWIWPRTQHCAKCSTRASGSSKCVDVRCLDVNILVSAFRFDTPEHPRYEQLLTEWANGSEPLGLPDVTLSGYLRIVTNRRIFAVPTPPDHAWSDVRSLLAAPAALMLRPGPTHWSTFERLADDIDASGADLPDAYVAAYAVENHATFISADRGFARFASLRWQHPLG